jgi:hypothetical protein
MDEAELIACVSILTGRTFDWKRMEFSESE